MITRFKDLPIELKNSMGNYLVEISNNDWIYTWGEDILSGRDDERPIIYDFIRSTANNMILMRNEDAILLAKYYGGRDYPEFSKLMAYMEENPTLEHQGPTARLFYLAHRIRR